MCLIGFACSMGCAGFVMRSMLAATLMFAAASSAAQAQMTTPVQSRAAPSRSRCQPSADPATRDCRPPAETAERRWRRPNVCRSSPTSPGSANTTAPSPAKSASAWSRPSRNIRRPKGGKPTGVLNPQERGALAETAQAAAGECRLEDRHRCRHRRAARHPDKAGAAADPPTPTARNGPRRPAPSRSCSRGARRPTRPRRSSPSRKRRSRPGARSTTPWSSRISSCCRACRA